MQITKLIGLGLGLAWACGNPAAQAVTISIVPSATQIQVGDSVTADLAVSGLEGSTSLGVFDVSLGFAGSVLAFGSAVYGDPVSGDQLDLFGLGSITQTTLGTDAVDLFELSLDLPADLDALQLDSFVIARLTFEALAAGTSPLTFGSVRLGDSLGSDLSVETHGAEVSVAEVPEPETLSLLLIGLASVQIGRQRARSFVSWGRR